MCHFIIEEIKFVRLQALTANFNNILCYIYLQFQIMITETFNWSPVQIAGKINRFIREYGLRDIGQLEQDLVFGDAGAKEVISILRSKQVCSERETKNRLHA